MYAEIRKTKQEKVNQLLTECGVFWAFSNQQFEENKTPLQEGEKYVSIGDGGYMPKGNVEKLRAGFRQINKEERQRMKATPGARIEAIKHELNNYECYYTGDITEALNALGKGYTRAEVLKVYNEVRETINY